MKTSIAVVTTMICGRRVEDSAGRGAAIMAADRSSVRAIRDRPRSGGLGPASCPSSCAVHGAALQNARLKALDVVGTKSLDSRVVPPPLQSRHYGAAIASVVAAALIAKVLRALVGLGDPAMIFLTAVLAAAVLGGLGPSIAASILSVLVYDFFFVEPRFTFTVTDPRDVVSLIVFLIVAVFTSHLMARARSHADIAHQRDVVLAEKAKTEAVIEAIEDGLIVLDPSGVVVDVNHVACAIVEVEPNEVVGMRFDDLATTHPHYLRLREAVRELEAQPGRDRDRVEITLFLRGRDHQYVLRRTRFATGDDAPAGLILTLQDVTYLRDQEARRENLVATLSHELRTPLTSLRMALELLRQRRDVVPEEQRGLVDTAYEDVLRLQEVAQQFLDLARGRAMTIAVERRPIDLAVLAARVESLLGIQARDKRIAFEVGPLAA